jgi:hypothetical protein
LPCSSRDLLDEAQVDVLAGNADHLVIVVFVIFAPIARAEIADGEEREIVVVRHPVEEGVGAAVADDAVLERRPEIGADDEPPRAVVQHDHLGAVLVVADLALAALLQLGDHQLGEEFTVVGQLPELGPPGGEIVLVLAVEAAGLEPLDQLGERDPVLARGVDHARHKLPPCSG